MFDPTHSSRDRTVFGLVDLAEVREHRGRFVALGIALVVLGALAIFTPLVTAVTTTLLLGWLLVLGGIAEGLHAISDHRRGGSGWSIASALFCLVAGALVIVFPTTTKLLVTLVLSGFLVVEGVLKILRALLHRDLNVWGWLFFDGLFSLILGVLLWRHWPSGAAWALGLLIGLELVSSGVSVLVIGLGARPLARMRA
jgi:uncharacterized membrane protein HdeD (DUF308 family)